MSVSLNRITRVLMLAVIVLILPFASAAQTLEVKAGRSAIVKESPSGSAPQFADRLPGGTQVTQLGDVPRYYQIQLADGRIGWSYKGNFIVVDSAPTPATPSSSVDKQSLLARTDVLKIIIIDVEVGDATLIICPEENDADRIRDLLASLGVALRNRPIDRLYISHYDHDHMGDAV